MIVSCGVRKTSRRANIRGRQQQHAVGRESAPYIGGSTRQRPQAIFAEMAARAQYQPYWRVLTCEAQNQQTTEQWV